MVKAVFLDFYGTVVDEADDVIKEMIKVITETGEVENPFDVIKYWWKIFNELSDISYGENFVVQREIEYKALEETVKHFNANCDLKSLSEIMFQHWLSPKVFDDAKLFLESCPVPIYIVSNIDNCDINTAFNFNNLKVDGIFTSEMARSYKPRSEIFELALKTKGLSKNEVVHIGDSFRCDYEGARSAGINALWLNRGSKPATDDVKFITSLRDALKTEYFM